MKSNFVYPISEVTAEICKVPLKLVENLAVIWGGLSCSFELDPEKFGQLCEETKNIYFQELGWFSLPPSLHKIFEHGKHIISSCPLPIGLTNEEGAEANNKFMRSFRLHHSRKTSWEDGIQDLFHRLMDVSDPFIQETLSAQAAKRQARRALSPKILALLKAPQEPKSLKIDIV